LLGGNFRKNQNEEGSMSIFLLIPQKIRRFLMTTGASHNPNQYKYWLLGHVLGLQFRTPKTWDIRQTQTHPITAANSMDYGLTSVKNTGVHLLADIAHTVDTTIDSQTTSSHKGFEFCKHPHFGFGSILSSNTLCTRPSLDLYTASLLAGSTYSSNEPITNS